MQKRVLAIVGVLVTLSIIASVWSSRSVTAQERKGKSENAQPSAVFTNSAAITILDQTPASFIRRLSTVSGVSGNIPIAPGGVKVTINGFSHTFPDDVGLPLVGPTGAAFLLQDGVGQGPDMVNVTYTIADTGATQLPDLTAWIAGTYRPASYYPDDPFPAPGPETNYGHPGPAGGGTATFSSVFGGTNPNGDWKLFVIDFVAGDVGNISGGWSIEITAAAPVNDAPYDRNADGKSDFGVTRNVGGRSCR